jgi:hypothetical protein
MQEVSEKARALSWAQLLVSQKILKEDGHWFASKMLTLDSAATK